MLSWQATNFLDWDTHADWTPTWCQDYSGTLQIHRDDCEVLLDIYLATDGDNWTNIQNSNNEWFQWDGSSICWDNWYGIPGCERDPIEEKYRIQSISLDNNNLSGTLPTSIYTLPSLSSLYIKNNPNLVVNIDDLTQSIYASNYTTINISNNIIYWDISNFDNLPNLEYLEVSCYTNTDLDNCTATGDISFVPSLPNLYALLVWWHRDVTFDLSYLSDAPQITQIYALDNYIVGDIDVLAGNTGMTRLDIGCWNLLEGQCDVSGNMSTLTNMPNLGSVSFDGLLNIEGDISVIFDKYNLQYVDLSHNPWIIGSLTASGATALSWMIAFDIDDTSVWWELPVEMYTWRYLQDLNIQGNNLEGSLLEFSAFKNLQGLHLGGNDLDYSTIWDSLVGSDIPAPPGCIPTPANNMCAGIPFTSSLQQLEINQGDIGWEIADIWNKFPNLTELELQFTQLTWPIPDSIASLTNLQDFVVHFNNLEWPIPTFLADLQLDQGKFQIESNCLDTDVSDSDFLSYLQDNAPGWNNQLNCRANIQVEASLDEDLTAGSCSLYTISYENLGPQKAIDVEIGQIFDENLILSDSIPPYSTGLVWRVYGTSEDPCYISGTQYGTGPYFAWYENMLQTNYEIPSIYDLAVMQGWFTGSQYTTEFGFVLDQLCPFIFGTTDHALCFLLFGSSFGDVDPSCGVGGEAGYIWDVWTVANGWTGSIEVELCVPADLTGSVSFSSKVSTVSTNENEESDDDNFQFMIQEPDNGWWDDEILGCTDPDADNYDPSATDNDNSCEYPEEEEENDEEEEQNSPRKRNNGPKASKDDCDEIDISWNYYDNKCTDDTHDSAETIVEEEIFDPSIYLPDLTDVRNYVRDLPEGVSSDVEQIKAFLFAKRAKLTSMMDYISFKPDEELTRWTWAKFLVAFIENVLQEEADPSRLKLCSNAYNDIAGLGDIKDYIIKACMHTIMWLENNGTDPLDTFNPHSILTRKDLVTTANRFINGNRDDGVYPYRAKHMQVMHGIGLIRNTDPEIVESRINAITILMRALEQYETLFADK